MIRRASDLHVNTVQAAALMGRDAEFGARTFGPDRVVACLIEEQTRAVKGKDGTEQLSTVQIHAAPEYADVLVPESRVTLPPAPHRPDGSTTYVISLEAVIVGDPAVDGVVAVCE